MRELQKAKLEPKAEKEGWELKWHDVIEDVEPSSDQYTMVLAHEFFDALPMHILQVSYFGKHSLRIREVEASLS